MSFTIFLRILSVVIVFTGSLCFSQNKGTVGPPKINAFDQWEDYNLVLQLPEEIYVFDNTTNVFPFEGDPNASVTVPQGFFSVFNLDHLPDNILYIGSRGAYPCLEITLISESKTTVLISHVDTLRDPQKTVELFLSYFKEDPIASIIINTHSGRGKILPSYIKRLKRYSPTKIRLLSSTSLYLDRDLNLYLSFLVPAKGHDIPSEITFIEIPKK